MFVWFPFSTCILSLPGRNEVACFGGDAEDVGVASCEAVSESLSPMSTSPGTLTTNWRASEASEMLFSHVYEISRYIYI